jgi:general stress protein 26
MAKIKELAKIMKKLDFCMMTTTTKGGLSASRPMSNNGQVEYDGNSYFFTMKKSRTVKDLTKNKNVNLSFQGAKGLFLSVEGKGKIVKNQAAFEQHWTKDLDKWFKKGPATPGVVMIHVKAKRVKYWQNEKEGEVVLK